MIRRSSSLSDTTDAAEPLRMHLRLAVAVMKTSKVEIYLYSRARAHRLKR